MPTPPAQNPVLWYRSVLAAAAVALFGGGCSKQAEREVVLYASIDQTYARRAADQFEQESGIRVRLVSDTEVAKSSGLLSRLMAERNHPVADVFWSGDVARAFALERMGMLVELTGEAAWQGLPPASMLAGRRIIGSASRARVIIYHRGKAEASASLPQSFEDLSKPAFANRSCLANPLFGTSSVHAAALFRSWGEVRARAFYQNFADNGGTMVTSNGEVQRRVASGEFTFGITDSDDLNVAWKDGKEVDAVIPVEAEAGGLLMPSAAVVIRGSPHPDEAQALAAFLSSKRTERLMAESEAAHFSLREDLEMPESFRGRTLPVALGAEAWAKIDLLLPEIVEGFLQEWAADQQR